jgi:hypothetical protein
VAVNTKKVEGRRKLRFESLDDVLAEAERLASGEVKLLGNWSLAQILQHLAKGLNSTIDGTSLKIPLFMKLAGRLFMKKKFIYGEIPAGIEIPKEAQAQFLPPGNIEPEAALSELRAAIERVKSADARADHPIFGKMSLEESDQFQMRHAEMHFSFVLPLS